VKLNFVSQNLYHLKQKDHEEHSFKKPVQ